MKLFKFYKPGCSPCSTMKKIMRSMDLSDYELIEINMDLEENQDLYPDVDTVPRLRLENGAETYLLPKYKLEAWLKENK